MERIVRILRKRARVRVRVAQARWEAALPGDEAAALEDLMCAMIEQATIRKRVAELFATNKGS
jgi:hypothetical protein